MVLRSLALSGLLSRPAARRSPRSSGSCPTQRHPRQSLASLLTSPGARGRPSREQVPGTGRI